MAANSFSRKDSTPAPSPTTLLPLDPESSQFFTFFPHFWDFLYADVPEAGGRPSWHTQTAYPLDARNAWSAYHDPDVLLGVRFGAKTWYFLFDIDRGSKYHPSLSLSSFRHLLQVMEDGGFTRYTVVSSSESGGIHLYFFLPEAVSTSVLASALHTLLTDEGIEIGDGTLEVFPARRESEDTLVKAHRLPLQCGSYVLDSVTFNPLHRDIGRFLKEAAIVAQGQDSDGIAALLSRAEASRTPRRMGKAASSFSTEGGAFRAHLRECIEEGWTGNHQTNHLLWKIGMYGRIFLDLSDQALTAYIVDTAQRSPGYRDYCRHQHEIERRARDWMRFCMKHYYPYGSEKQERDTKSFRQDFRHTALGIGILPMHLTPQEATHEETMRRIRFVVEELKGEGLLLLTVTGRVGAILLRLKETFGTGSSLQTLYKEPYLSLWHPSYDDPFPALPDPWDDEGQEGGGVMVSDLPVERDYTVFPNRLIRALPPAREKDGLKNNPSHHSQKSFSDFSPPVPSSSTAIHKNSLLAHSGGASEMSDNHSLSDIPTLLPGCSYRVKRGVSGLLRGEVVLVDSFSRTGRSLTVITGCGRRVRGVPPNALGPPVPPD